MKTKMFFVAAVVAMVSLSSCKKDYTCECDYDLQGETVTGTAEIEDAKKKDAEEACDEFESDVNAIGSNASCTLSEK